MHVPGARCFKSAFNGVPGLAVHAGYDDLRVKTFLSLLAHPDAFNVGIEQPMGVMPKIKPDGFFLASRISVFSKDLLRVIV